VAKADESRKDSSIKRPPATTPEGREQQLIALAMEATEKRIRNGTASAQELIHFIKAGSPNAKLERKILEQQSELLEAKTSAIKSQERVEELYMSALSAMRTYSGDPSKGDDHDD
jgi:hypothetical protein